MNNQNNISIQIFLRPLVKYFLHMKFWVSKGVLSSLMNTFCKIFKMKILVLIFLKRTNAEATYYYLEHSTYQLLGELNGVVLTVSKIMWFREG